MKRAKLRKAGTVQVTPLEITDFTEAKAKPVTMEKITKKQIRQAAEEMGLPYEEEYVVFAKKVLSYLMGKA